MFNTNMQLLSESIFQPAMLVDPGMSSVVFEIYHNKLPGKKTLDMFFSILNSMQLGFY